MEADPKTLQRRLNKSVKLAEKLRQKNLYESEANKELAKRNHTLRRSVLEEQRKVDKVKSLISHLETLVKRNEESSPEQVKEDFQTLVEDLKQALYEVEPVAPPAPVVEESQTKANRVSQRRQSSLFVHLPELSGTSLVRKSAEFSLQRSPEDSLIEGEEESENGIQTKIPGFNNPLFEHFLVVGASPEAAAEFAHLIQAAEDDTISNRFMRTLGGFLSHPRFMMGSSSSNNNTGLKTPSAAVIAGQTATNSSISHQTPAKPPTVSAGGGAAPTKEDSSAEGESEMKREASIDWKQFDEAAMNTANANASTVAPNASTVPPPTSASKSIFSYFSRGSSNTVTAANTPQQPSSTSYQPHPHNAGAVADLLKAVSEGEITATSDDVDTSVVSVDSSSDLRLDFEETESVTKSPSKEDHGGGFFSSTVGVGIAGGGDTSPAAASAASGGATSTGGGMETESPTKNLIAGTTNALKGFGGLLTRMSVASDKAASAVVNTALKGKSMPNLTRNRSSSAAANSTHDVNSILSASSDTPDSLKPIGGSSSDTALNEMEVATVTSETNTSVTSASVDHSVGLPPVPPIVIPATSTAPTSAVATPATSVTASSSAGPAVPAKAASLLLQADKKIGTATTEGSILYRYPPTVEPPPPEISDFCLPLGGKLRRLLHKDEDTMVQEILFGHSHSKRSGRCFIFLLEDKTTMEDVSNDEAGIGTGRLYGICVSHPRLVKTNVVQHHASGSSSSNSSTANKQNGEKAAPRNSVHSSSGDDPSEDHDCYEFESSVCYAFITRFPLFDFFFQIIFDMITLERLVRMEMAVDQSDADMKYSRNVYQYLPQTILDNCLERLTRLQPPKYNERIFFSTSKSIQTIESFRPAPRYDFPEHYANAADWALPTLLSWMPVDTIVWSLSLLMSEAKLIVVGYDSGIVSCAVMGLLVLLRPLEWVAPLIPMLPLKLIDFIESPVPILAGLTLDANDKAYDVSKLLNRCSDPSDGTVLAVLDVTKRELLVSGAHRPVIKTLGMPNSDTLAENLKGCLRKDFDEPRGRGRPLYAVSGVQKTASRHAHDLITAHVQGIIALAIEWVPREPSHHSQSVLFSATAEDAFSDDSDEASEDEDDTTQKSLLEYYAQMVGEDGDKPDFLTAGAMTKQETAAVNLRNKAASQNRYKRSTSISSQGSSSLVNGSIAISAAITASAEPVKLTVEMLMDVDTDGFFKRFRDTQLFSEHVRVTTEANADTTANGETSVLSVEGNLIDFDSGNDVLTELPNNRLSLPGSNSSSRRQSMNLIFTQDHKLRLSNNDTLSAVAAATAHE